MEMTSDAVRMDLFGAYMQPILSEEGRGTLTDRPGDRGGVTIWGVTEVRARAAGYAGPMAEMTMQQALGIYRLFFWLQPMFDQLAPMVPPIARFMLDCGINCGPATPGGFLQRALNVLNRQGAAFPALNVDGHCGAMTRAGLTAYRQGRAGQDGDQVLLHMIQAQASVRYLELAERDPTQQVNEFGWQRNRAFA